MTFADVTQTTAPAPANATPPAPTAPRPGGVIGGGTATGTGATSSGVGMHYKTQASVHGMPPGDAVKGDIYLAMDAGSISNGTGWNTGGLTYPVTKGDFLLYSDPEWHVIAHKGA